MPLRTFLAPTQAGVSRVNVVEGPLVAVDSNLAAFDTIAENLKDSGVPVAPVALMLEERGVALPTTATGTDNATSAPLPPFGYGVYPVLGADNFNGVKIHADDKILYHRINVVNLVPNKRVFVYPPTGGNINGLGVDVGYPTASGGSATLICADAVANTWLAFD